MTNSDAKENEEADYIFHDRLMKFDAKVDKSDQEWI